jgi:hypothetical protein
MRYNPAVLTIDEAKKFAQWMTRKTSPEKPAKRTEPNGPTNG